MNPTYRPWIYLACLFALLAAPVYTLDAQESNDSASENAPAEATDQTKQASRKDKPKRTRRESRMERASKKSNAFLELFKPIAESASEATVGIKKGTGKRNVALGVMVDSDRSFGYVLTKHSELRDPIRCELSDGRVVSAYVYGIHEETDLAMLKVFDAGSFPTVSWAEANTPIIGDWVASVSQEELPLGVGIVGVNARLIPRARGFMGIEMAVAGDHVKISNVIADSPAEKGGAKTNDIILMVNDRDVNNMASVREAVGGYAPGETIRMTVNRDGSIVHLSITLGLEQEINDTFDRSLEQNTMGTELSERRDDFPKAVQHDIGLQPSQIGGPVIDVDGNVVGLNIARRGRVDTLMLPTSILLPIIEELRSGKRNPAVVNQDRIEEIDRQLVQFKGTLEVSSSQEAVLQSKLKELTKDEKAALKKLEEAQEELQAATREKLRAEFELENATDALGHAQEEYDRLQKKRDKLQSGLQK